jgi:putative membrane-bound dehydrogenase-like protein
LAQVAVAVARTYNRQATPTFNGLFAVQMGKRLKPQVSHRCLLITEFATRLPPPIIQRAENTTTPRFCGNCCITADICFITTDIFRNNLSNTSRPSVVSNFSAVVGIAFLVFGSAARADESLSDRLPRTAPQEPAAALDQFSVLPGFRIEQVATEPLVRDPVAMSFDENGRLYVVEMCDYSEQDRDFLGTIRRLEDTDGDGRFDKATLFADRLSWPTAVICYDGGIFVGAAPDILYLKDNDGDGKADQKKVVFTGFGRENVQGLLNSFCWGLDNRIYGSASNTVSKVSCPERPDRAPVNCRGRDFSFDPRALDFRTESGGAQHGMSFDDWGRRFVCSNGDHLQMIVYDDRYAGRNRRFAMPPARISIAADGPQAEVFRISPIEPWRIVRTEWRKSGKSKGVVEGNGQPAGYFTSATGVTAYRGDAFPAEFRNQAFMADVGSNIIHRKVLEPKGEILVGKRVDQGREFVASKDIWFRPVQMANAPDGTLYVCDMYREVIEHPKAIPPEIKAHLDLTSGSDRGRIYRVVPDNFKQKSQPQLANASTADLIRTLEHRNGWHRDTAARLLFQRQDRSAVPSLVKLASESSLPECRIQAIYTLKGLGALTEQIVLKSLDDAHPRVREHAIRTAESLIGSSAKVREKLCGMDQDQDVRVRFQLALTVGELPDADRIAPLGRLALQNLDDTWIQAAVMNSLPSGAGKILTAVADMVAAKPTPAGLKLVQRLAEQVAMQPRAENLNEVESVLAATETKSPAVAKAIVLGIARHVRRDASSTANERSLWSPAMETVLRRLLDGAMKSAGDQSQSLNERVEAIHTLALGEFNDVRPLLLKLIAERQSQGIQLAAIEAFGEFSDSKIADILIEAWPELTPKLRSTAADVLFSRGAWLLALFDAVNQKKIPATEIDREKLALLERHPDKKIRRRGEELLKQLKIGRRDDVVQSYQEAMKNLTGDSDRGREVFRQNCAACHRLEDVGYEIGPPLAAFKNRGGDAIVLNVLDPNREVLPQYQQWMFADADGRQHSGIIKAEGEGSITLLRGENATETILRADIESQTNTGRSLMPEGLEKQVDPQKMTDLISYIMSLK